MPYPRTCLFLLAAGLVAGTASALAAGTASVSPAEDCITLEDFSASKVGEFPAQWRVRNDDGKPIYTVKEEGGTRFLRASSPGLGLQAAMSREWNLDEYPVLAWRWRPVEFPRGGDERSSSSNDSALAVYLLVPYSKIRGPQAVKYVWSERVPAGTKLESNWGLTQVRVLRSGAAGKDAWTEERVDVRADFLAAFEVAKAPTPGGIAVLTDADDTKSTATGDYADFRACRK